MIGTILQNRYKIIQTLKSGNFGDTFLAEDTHLPGNPKCLVKRLKQNAIPDFKVRFEKEAKMLDNLGKNHDQIPKLLANFEENNEFYLVQEYIEGHTLKHEFDNLTNPITEKEAIDLISEILSILKFVHSYNVIHRDINPNNIMRRTTDNKLILIDFGAVKEISSQGANGTIAIGTPGYIPPEQGIGKPELCSDIYAVGMLAIQFLTGIYPTQFQRNQQGEIDNPNFRSNISASFAKVLDKMVCENSSDRYQSCAEILKITKPGVTVIILPDGNPNFSKLLLGLGAILIIIGLFLFIQRDNSGKLSLNGEQITGELTTKDTLDPDGYVYFDEYVIEGKEGQNITINLNSDDFDPVLVLLNSQKKQLVINNDISPENLNSEINITLPYTGNYIVKVKSHKTTEKGKYKLSAKGN